MTNFDPNLTLLAIAVFNALAALLAWLAKREASAARVTAEATHAVAAATAVEVGIVKQEMNGMKTELVKKTGEASFAAGADKERVKGEEKAAALAEGKLESSK